MVVTFLAHPLCVSACQVERSLFHFTTLDINFRILRTILYTIMIIIKIILSSNVTFRLFRFQFSPVMRICSPIPITKLTTVLS